MLGPRRATGRLEGSARRGYPRSLHPALVSTRAQRLQSSRSSPDANPNPGPDRAPRAGAEGTPAEKPGDPADPLIPATHGGGRAHSADHELVRAALAREPRAVDELCERLRCVGRILVVLNVRAGRKLDDHDLADLVQDVLLLLWRKLETFSDESSLETWAYGVARFELLNALRRKKRHAVSITEVEPEGRPEADETSDARHDAGALLTAIDELGTTDARLLRLKHLEELTFEEIGARLDMSVNTAKTRYYRALARLQLRWRARDPRGERDERGEKR